MTFGEYVLCWLLKSLYSLRRSLWRQRWMVKQSSCLVIQSEAASLMRSCLDELQAKKGTTAGALPPGRQVGKVRRRSPRSSGSGRSQSKDLSPAYIQVLSSRLLLSIFPYSPWSPHFKKANPPKRRKPVASVAGDKISINLLPSYIPPYMIPTQG